MIKFQNMVNTLNRFPIAHGAHDKLISIMATSIYGKTVILNQGHGSMNPHPLNLWRPNDAYMRQ